MGGSVRFARRPAASFVLLRPSPVIMGGGWAPSALTQQRFVSGQEIQLQTDYGKGVPMGQPPEQKRGLYVVEPEGRIGSFKRFLGMAREEAPLIVASIACVAIFSTATLAIPQGFGELLDHASRGEMPWGTAWRLLCGFSVAGAANFGRLLLIGTAGERAVLRMRSQLYRAISKQPMEFFDSPRNRTGALVQRLTMDTNVVGACLTEGLSNGAKNLAQMVGSLAIMLYFSPTLTACVACVLPPVAVLAGQYGRMVRKMQSQKQDSIAAMGTVAEERLSTIRTVKAFAKEEDESAHFTAKARKVLKISNTMITWNASYAAFLHITGYLGLYCVVWAGSMLVAVNDLTAGGLFSFMLYTIYCGAGITGVTNLVTDINKGYGASIRYNEIIDLARAQEEAEGSKKGTKLAKVEGKFAFKDVSFVFPTRPDAAIFEKLSLELVPGKCTVVVGSSGSGKSTLALLLLKLYDPSTGSITLDGHEIRGLDSAWLRSIIGYVSQEPVLFGSSIADNIAYGVPGRRHDDKLDEWTRDGVIAAAKKANAHDFISALPEGYDTFVGEGGRSLSGGQKQRIAIARALIRSPQLLILDEATSALDSESEAVVQAAIERLIADARAENSRGVLMFAHRLSMIRQADTVVVLKDGTVHAMGTYEEVLNNAHFRHLTGVDSQGNVDPTKNDLTAVLERTPHHLEEPPAKSAREEAAEAKRKSAEMPESRAAGERID